MTELAENVITVGQILRRIRKQRRLTCQCVADMCGMSKQGVWRVEEGEEPKFDSIRKICAALGVRLDTLCKKLPPVEIKQAQPRRSPGRPSLVADK